MNIRFPLCLSIICFTEHGHSLMENIRSSAAFPVQPYCKCKSLNNHTPYPYVNQSIQAWTRERFENHDAILFIGAAGIAVRAIAPCVNDKLSDSPVLVMDDLGQFVIPLLSGHMGGSNEIAREIAKLTGARPIITTATDTHNLFSIDVFAHDHQLAVYNKDGIARVSSKIIQGLPLVMTISKNSRFLLPDLYELKNAGISELSHSSCVNPDLCILSPDPAEYRKEIENLSHYDTSGLDHHPFPLCLIPKTYLLGIGCKKGKTVTDLQAFASQCLENHSLNWNLVRGIASVDRKQDEEGLVLLARRMGIPFLTYSADELASVEGEYSDSTFVSQQVGIGNVCERAAMAAAGTNAKLVLSKQIHEGMTLAIARSFHYDPSLEIFPDHTDFRN